MTPILQAQQLAQQHAADTGHFAPVAMLRRRYYNHLDRQYGRTPDAYRCVRCGWQVAVTQQGVEVAA